MWSAQDETQGKLIHIKGFPKGHHVKLFRLVLATERTDYVATNDSSVSNTVSVARLAFSTISLDSLHDYFFWLPSVASRK